MDRQWCTKELAVHRCYKCEGEEWRNGEKTPWVLPRSSRGIWNHRIMENRGKCTSRWLLLMLCEKCLLGGRNGEFNTCVLKVCQWSGARITWHLTCWIIYLEAFLPEYVQRVCLSSMSFNEGSCYHCSNAVSSLLIASGLPKAVIKN